MSDINPSSMLAVGTVLNGKYRIERHLSSGGFGNTYMATNLTFNDVVAVKEFFMRGISQRDGDSSTISVSNPENRDLFSEQLEKFKKEAQRIRQLRSQHIVRVHDLFEANGTAYYVMDYIDGESLAARLKRTNTPLTESETRKYLGQVLDALETIHGAGLCHMDLKPENIMVDKDDNAILIDFGASKRSDNERFTSTVSGVSYTNGYAPPEQLEQDTAHFGPWTDIYALGATLYKLLTNRKPPMPSALYSDTTPDKHEVLPFPEGVSQQMQQIIIPMMAVRWKDRPQSIADLRTMLEQSVDEQTQVREVNYTMNSDSEDDTLVRGAQPANVAFDEVEETSSSRKWMYGVIGALLIALVGVCYMLYSNSQKQKAEEREQFVQDSIAQEQRIRQAIQDSIEKVRQDSIQRIEEARQRELQDIEGEYVIEGKKIDAANYPSIEHIRVRKINGIPHLFVIVSPDEYESYKEIDLIEGPEHDITFEYNAKEHRIDIYAGVADQYLEGSLFHYNGQLKGTLNEHHVNESCTGMEDGPKRYVVFNKILSQ